MCESQRLATLRGSLSRCQGSGRRPVGLGAGEAPRPCYGVSLLPTPRVADLAQTQGISELAAWGSPLWPGLSLSLRGERLPPPSPTSVCAYFSLFLVGFPQLEGARASGGQPGVGVGSAVPSRQAETRGGQGLEEKPCRRGGGQGRPFPCAGPGCGQGVDRPGPGVRGGRPPALLVATGSWVCVGGSKEGRREEAGFLRPPQPSETD